MHSVGLREDKSDLVTYAKNKWRECCSQLQTALEQEAGATSHTVSAVVGVASGERGVCGRFEYAGGNSIVTGST
jgi:hypothetical protein